MPYRRTSKYNAARIEAMARGRERARMDRPAPEYPFELPDLRMRISIERFDCGCEKHVFELHKTSRVDTYSVTVDGKPWKRGGLSAVLEGIRKACPRVTAPRAMT